MRKVHWKEEEFVSSTCCFNVRYEKTFFDFSWAYSFLNIEVLSCRIIFKHCHELSFKLALIEINGMSSICILWRLWSIFNRRGLVLRPDSVCSWFQPKLSSSLSKSKDFSSWIQECLFKFEVIIKCKLERIFFVPCWVDHIFWIIEFMNFVKERETGFR